MANYCRAVTKSLRGTGTVQQDKKVRSKADLSWKSSLRARRTRRMSRAVWRTCWLWRMSMPSMKRMNRTSSQLERMSPTAVHLELCTQWVRWVMQENNGYVVFTYMKYL